MINPMKSAKRFTLAEVLVAMGIMLLFLNSVYTLYRHISKTAAYTHFVEEVSLGENLFFRKFMEIQAQASLPANLRFPANPSLPFQMAEKKEYCLYLRPNAITRPTDQNKIEPLIDVYECTSEKEGYPATFPGGNRPLKIKRHWMILNAKGEIFYRSKTLAFTKFTDLMSQAPVPQNTMNPAHYDNFETEELVLKKVFSVEFSTLNETDITGFTADRKDDKPREQKVKIRLSQARNERIDSRDGSTDRAGTYKDIEFPFVPTVPIKKLAI